MNKAQEYFKNLPKEKLNRVMSLNGDTFEAVCEIMEEFAQEQREGNIHLESVAYNALLNSGLSSEKRRSIANQIAKNYVPEKREVTEEESKTALVEEIGNQDFDHWADDNIFERGWNACFKWLKEKKG